MNTEVIKGELLRCGYIDVESILAQIQEFLGDQPTFEFEVKFCPLEQIFTDLVLISGKFQGTELQIWLKTEFPKAAPIIVLCPPENCEFVSDHPIVRELRDLTELNLGRVELPLLSNWAQGSKLDTAVLESVLFSLSLVPWYEEVRKRKPTSNSSSQIRISTFEGMVNAILYSLPEQVIEQGTATMKEFPHLLPQKEDSGEKSGVYLRGTVGVWYHGTEYPTPISIWFPLGFPKSSPEIFVTPTEDMEIDTGHENLNWDGRVILPILQRWGESSKNSLVDVIQIMRGVFSQKPPMYKIDEVKKFMSVHGCDQKTAERLLKNSSFEDASMNYLMDMTSTAKVLDFYGKEDLYKEFPSMDRTMIDTMLEMTAGDAKEVRAIILESDGIVENHNVSELEQLKRDYPTLIQLIDDLYEDSLSVEYVRVYLRDNMSVQPPKLRELAIIELSKEFPDADLHMIKKMLNNGRNVEEVRQTLKEQLAFCEKFLEIHPSILVELYCSSKDIHQAEQKLKEQYEELSSVSKALLGTSDRDVDLLPVVEMEKQQSIPDENSREEFLEMYSAKNRLFGFGDTVLVSEDAWDWKKAIVTTTEPELMATLINTTHERTFPFVQADISPQELAHVLFDKFDDQRVVRIMMSYINNDDIFMKKRAKPKKKERWGQVRKLSDDTWQAKLDGEVVGRLFKTKKDAARFLLTAKLGTSLDSIVPTYIGGTLMDRKVMAAYNFDANTKYSLVLIAAHHAQIPFSEFRAEMDNFLENIGEAGASEIKACLPVDSTLENEDLEFGALSAMGWTLQLFVDGLFVKTFKPLHVNDEIEPLYLNRINAPAEYQIFKWKKDSLISSDQQTCQMLVDDAMQAGGSTPNLAMLQKYFEDWQVGPAMDLCQKLYEEAMNLIAAQELQAEEERKAAMEFKCTGCFRYRPKEVELCLLNCGHTRCFECAENFMLSEWAAFEASENQKVPHLTCQVCSTEIHQDDIRRVDPKLAAKVADLQLQDLLKQQGAVQCYHDDCDVLFFPAETDTCSNGHVNCSKCHTSHTLEEECPIDEHAPNDIYIIRRFLWPDKQSAPPEFDYLKKQQKCTSNSVVGPKAFRQIGGSFGLINSVRDCDIVAGGISNLNSGGQVAKNRMTISQILQRCAGRIRYIHKRYKDKKREKTSCESNQVLVQKMYFHSDVDLNSLVIGFEL